MRNSLWPWVRGSVVRRMAIIKKSTNSKCWRGYGHFYTVGRNVNWCSTKENSVEVPQKTENITNK